jgi:hypothetical protein
MGEIFWVLFKAFAWMFWAAGMLVFYVFVAMCVFLFHATVWTIKGIVMLIALIVAWRVAKTQELHGL